MAPTPPVVTPPAETPVPATPAPAAPAAELPTCHGLALSGFGSRAAYQAGAIHGMLQKEGMNFNWDVVTGIGSGALNAAILSMYSVDQTKAASLELDKFWKELTTDKIYTPNGL